MKLLKTIILSVALISLFSCSERLSPKRSDAGQQQVKQQVVKLLEEEYKQPFELESFDYEYKTQYPNASGNKPYTTFGVFNFKIKAINNPVIIMDFDFRDDKKDSIKSLIESFKKTQLKIAYCVALTRYYKNLKATDELKQPYVSEAEKICNKLDKTDYLFYKKWYLKHQTN